MSHVAHPFRSEAARAAFLAHYDRRAASWPVPATTHLVPTDLGETFVRDCGLGGGEPLVLLPGIGSSSLMWLANVAGLAASFRVLAVDNVYDTGRSVWTRAPTGGDDFVDWLAQVLDGLGLESAHVLGASYGGWIAARFGLARPERVRGLVLFAPAGTVAPLSTGFLTRAVASAIPLRVFPRMLLRWLAADLLAQGPEGEAMVEDVIDDGVMAMRCFRSRRLVPPDVLGDDELRALPLRTMLLLGDRERVFDAAAATARMRSVAPHVVVHVVPGAGHDLPMARPEVFDRIVVSFLRPDAAPPR